MDFQKKTSYLYDYKMADKSVGFARWDVRNGMLRLQVNVRTDLRENEGEYDVSFCANDGSFIELGHMKVSDGSGEFRYMGLSDNVQNSGKSYDKVKEIFLGKNGEYFFNGSFEEKNTEEKSAEQNSRSKVQSVISFEKEKTGYERLYAEKRRVDLFADDDIYDCLEIEPEDIKDIPDGSPELMRNSFLNHGFYAYRHLILGKQNKEDGTDYIIGVPGIYTKRDKSMAGMFGFEHFKFSVRSDVRLSQFGYWYKVL